MHITKIKYIFEKHYQTNIMDNDVNKYTSAQYINYVRLKQELSEKEKSYDMNAVHDYINEIKSTPLKITNSKNFVEFFFLFKIHTLDESLYDFPYTNADYLLPTYDNTKIVAYSFNKHSYETVVDFTNVINTKNSVYFITINDKTLDQIELPKKWLKFLKKHFAQFCADKKEVESLIDYLCLKYIELFAKIDNVNVLETEKKLILSYKINQNIKSLTGEKEYTKIHAITSPKFKELKDINLICQVPDLTNLFITNLDLSNSIQDDLNCEIIDKEANVYLFLENDKFTKSFLTPILMKTFIKSFFSCEALFMPGVNISKEKQDLTLYRRSVEKEQEYTTIVNAEYLLILAYIIKIAQKYLSK